ARDVQEILDDVLGLEKIVCGEGQIAIRRAHNVTHETPPEPHLDGFATLNNKLAEGRIYNHTALVGIFLTPVRRAISGNFTVWPGSHYKYEEYFRRRGPQALTETMPNIDVGAPVQLLSGVGDVVLAHYSLGHAAAVNTSDADRIAIFFRISLRSIA